MIVCGFCGEPDRSRRQADVIGILCSRCVQVLLNLPAERKLLQVFGLKKATLTRLRLEKGLPFISLGLSRVYSIPDLSKWLLENQRVLNRGMAPGKV
jgi:hypothetical protein